MPIRSVIFLAVAVRVENGCVGRLVPEQGSPFHVKRFAKLVSIMAIGYRPPSRTTFGSG